MGPNSNDKCPDSPQRRRRDDRKEMVMKAEAEIEVMKPANSDYNTDAQRSDSLGVTQLLCDAAEISARAHNRRRRCRGLPALLPA